MEGKHDIVAPIFKTKNSIVNKEEFIPRPATKLQVDNIELWCKQSITVRIEKIGIMSYRKW